MLDMYAQDDDVIVKSTDSVGGFTARESAVVPMLISMAYLDESKGGAASVNLIFKDSDENELRITEYISGGRAKGQKTFYISKTNKKVPLPGWSKINDLCLTATSKQFKEQTAEPKELLLWDYDTQGEKLQTKKVITSLLGAQVKIGVLLVKVDVNVLNPAFDQTKPINKLSNSEYIPSGETREINEADKYFNIDTDLTTAEVNAGSTEAKFIHTWLKKWEGELKDKSTKVVTTTAGPASGAPTGTDNDLFDGLVST